ncbi:hypothetical protein B566_EDAN010960 [Ephemera danica]|nr:hypothetical protein B566_EDAN010960 [Ephemera danica]
MLKMPGTGLYSNHGKSHGFNLSTLRRHPGVRHVDHDVSRNLEAYVTELLSRHCGYHVELMLLLVFEIYIGRLFIFGQLITRFRHTPEPTVAPPLELLTSLVTTWSVSADGGRYLAGCWSLGGERVS